MYYIILIYTADAGLSAFVVPFCLFITLFVADYCVNM